MLKLTCSNLAKSGINSRLLNKNLELSKFSLFKGNNLKNFSIKSGVGKQGNGLDFFESNFKIESPPQNMPTVIN